jgi:hypothetical protein
MEFWRSEDDTRWIDFNGMRESDGCIHIFDALPAAEPALVLRDDVAEALGKFLLGYSGPDHRHDVVAVSGEAAPKFKPSLR